MFGRKDALIIPYSLIWGSFAIFWNYEAWTSLGTGQSGNWFMRLLGLPVLVAGLYFILGRFIHDALIRKSLCYGVTDRRILIMRGAANLTSRDIGALPMLDLSEISDGTGTIAFDSDEMGYSVFHGARHSGGWTLSRDANRQFFRIGNPRHVYELIRNQIQT